MVRHVRRSVLGGCLALIVIVLLGGPVSTGASGPQVLASTAWTAAIAQAAGAQDVAMLAPFELRHPPERDFRPSDITRAVAADYIVWAGYEGFMNQLLSAANIRPERSLRITTQNTPDHLLTVTEELASRWGTQTLQADWATQFRAVTDAMREQATRQDVSQVRAVVVSHLVPFVAWLGYDIIETVGFEEMTPARLHQLQSLQPDVVIDVWHNPTAEPLAVASGAKYVMLINFPGHSGTRTLIDVFLHNAEQLGLKVP